MNTKNQKEERGFSYVLVYTTYYTHFNTTQHDHFATSFWNANFI